MRELGGQIREYIDAVAPSIALDEVTGAADGQPRSTGQRGRKRLVTLGVAACVLVLAGVLLWRAADRYDRVETGGTSQGTTPVTDEWLEPFGPEQPTPPIPDGWRVLDLADFRFAVPEAWQAMLSPAWLQAAPGTVLVCTGEDASPCRAQTPQPSSVLTLGPAEADPGNGELVMVGTLDAIQVDGSERCVGCPPVYVFENGYELTVTGAEAEAILASFTDSGSRRVLQQGPLADTSGWQTISYEGTSLRVPAAWEITDLVASYREWTLPDGGRSMTGPLNPGQCGGAMFGSDTPHSIYLGESPMVASCPDSPYAILEPGEGVWIRPISEESSRALGTPLAEGTLGGLDLTVIRVDRSQRQTPQAVVDVVVRGGSTTLWMSVGTQDVAIARSILRSLELA